MKRSKLLIAALFAAGLAAADTIAPIDLVADTGRNPPDSLDVTLVRGETVDLNVRFLARGAAMDISAATAARLYSRTNGQPAGTAFIVTGALGRVSATNLATNGWATARVNVSSNLPSGSTMASWSLIVSGTNGDLCRASGVFRFRGEVYTGATGLTVPVAWYDPLGSAATVSNALHIADTNEAALRAAEAALRLAGDIAGSNNVSAEAVLRLAGDVAGSNNVAAEAVLRLAGDVAGSNNVAAEAVLRAAGDSGLTQHVADTYLPLSWTNGPVGIDAEHAKTNTYGGMVVKLGPRVQQGTGVASGDYSFAGQGSTASGDGAWANYFSTASGDGAWANYFSTASGVGSWAMFNSTASGVGAWAMYGGIASGIGSRAMLNSTASGLGSWANYLSTASGIGSWAMNNSTASGFGSWAMDGANATNDHAFSWRANSHGDGTFNIGPDGGADGFYIGETNLSWFLTHATDPNAVPAVWTNGIPGPGCTLVTSTNVIVTGATTFYLATNTATTWNLSVSATASQYCYTVRTAATNLPALVGSLFWENTNEWSCTSTAARYVLIPETGSVYRVRGGNAW